MDFYLMSFLCLVGLLLFTYVSYKIYEFFFGEKYDKYLKGERAAILKTQHPECIYQPSVNLMKKRFLMKFAAKRSFKKALGHFAFAGNYSDAQIDNFLCFESEDDVDDYCKTIVIYCKVPYGSILHRFNSVTFHRTDSLYGALHERVEQMVAANKAAASKMSKMYRLGNSKIEIEFGKNQPQNQADWVFCLNNGLAERFVEVFNHCDVKNLKYYNNMLVISMNYGQGENREFNLNNDYFLKNIDSLSAAAAALHSLANWQPTAVGGNYIRK